MALHPEFSLPEWLEMKQTQAGWYQDTPYVSHLGGTAGIEVNLGFSTPFRVYSYGMSEAGVETQQVFLGYSTLGQPWWGWLEQAWVRWS